MRVDPLTGAAGLYVHVPFCTSVCPYCDFAVVIAGDARREEYVRAVIAEAQLASRTWLAPFDTVYLGGGTPSALGGGSLTRLLDGVCEALPVARGAWLTLEANPEDVTAAAVASWRAMGFDMVSLGVQSLSDDGLARLGRRHTAAAAKGAVVQLLDAGFHTVSADLIFGWQGQTRGSWRRDLEAVAGLGVQHVSCYQLTVHQGTRFGRRAAAGERLAVGEGLQATLFAETHATLARLGLEAYEVSNFARGRDHRSRHNTKYWNHTPYLGLGPSAHSFDGRQRWWNRRKLRLWAADLAAGRLPVEGDEVLGAEELAFEEVMLGMRTTAGVDLAAVGVRLGADLVALNAARLAAWEAAGLVALDGGRVVPTPRGLAVAEALARDLELPRSVGTSGDALPAASVPRGGG
jgi:putative oxygen-independent coproporphyrinogen III oxidase